MADEEKEPAADAEQAENSAQEPKQKGPMKLALGLVLFVAMGAVAAMLAIPKKEVVHRFKGPFHHALLDQKFSSNVKDNNQRRYLQALLDCMYIAYDDTYLTTRITDPLYQPMLFDALGRVFAKKTLDKAFEGAAREAFLAEVGEALDPILFPVHVGATTLPFEMDEESGLRTGLSFGQSNFRGRFHDHVVVIDPAAKTIQFDAGDALTYEGGEEDLRLTNEAGEFVFLDITELDPEFAGELNIGVHGRIRKILARELIAQ